MTESLRRFPAPLHADKIPGGYVVRDANQQALAYVYERVTSAEAVQAKVLTHDEARRIAINIARVPDLLRYADSPTHDDYSTLSTRHLALSGRISVDRLASLYPSAFGGKLMTIPIPIRQGHVLFGVGIDDAEEHCGAHKFSEHFRLTLGLCTPKRSLLHSKASETRRTVRPCGVCRPTGLLLQISATRFFEGGCGFLARDKDNEP